jgi:potassium efflux system protein
MGFIYYICQKNGLAQVHFRWAVTARKTLRQNLSWYIPIVVVFTFILAGMDAVPEIEYGEVLARFALIVISAVDAVFVARILRFKGGITSVLVQKHPKSWLTRLRYIWYPLLIALPLLLLYLAIQGYYYSALEIERLTNLTIWLIFGLIVLNDLAHRLLMLSRRNLALRKARMNRQLQKEKLADSDADSTPDTPDVDPSSLMESSIDIGTIDEQTRTLLKTGIFILALMGLWNIWEPVFPALGIFKDVKLWSYTSVIDGVSQLSAITLADVVVAVIVIAITIIAVRNLPGLLEMILLNRLPLDPGARYAYAMVSRYTLTGMGIIIALNAVGIRWSSLQWLVAALGVGIGFGLQEIIANFICGLIILFERPVRVGDVVTIGETDGVVTKIRIRATTIRGWDRKELLVPNKEFITGRLLNWSLSDQTTRILITVGVAYGSDVDKAMTLMRESAEENERVLSDPEPLVSFDTFGDNALTLTMRAYLDSSDYRVVTTTDLNRAINQKFADAGIEISFPQRDVHLDAKGPLDVRVVSDSSAAVPPPKKTKAESDDADG